MSKSRRPQNVQTTLYWMVDAVGVVIYVGITNDITRRLGQHHAARWWPQVERVEIEVYPTRPAARAAELRMIRRHAPRFNDCIHARKARQRQARELDVAADAAELAAWSEAEAARRLRAIRVAHLRELFPDLPETAFPKIDTHPHRGASR